MSSATGSTASPSATAELSHSKSKIAEIAQPLIPAFLIFACFFMMWISLMAWRHFRGYIPGVQPMSTMTQLRAAALERRQRLRAERQRKQAALSKVPELWDLWIPADELEVEKANGKPWSHILPLSAEMMMLDPESQPLGKDQNPKMPVQVACILSMPRWRPLDDNYECEVIEYAIGVAQVEPTWNAGSD